MYQEYHYNIDMDCEGKALQMQSSDAHIGNSGRASQWHSSPDLGRYPVQPAQGDGNPFEGEIYEKLCG